VTFLNDLTTAPDGSVYVSDSGLKAGKEGLEPNGTDGVFKIANGKATKLALDKELGGPNGLVAVEGGVWVATFGKNEIYKVMEDGKRADVSTLPKGGLDGLVRLSDGSFLVSSWEASTVYRGKPGGAFEPLVTDVASPADIGFDSRRGRLLIPLFMKDAMAMVDVPGTAVKPAATAPAPAEKPTAAAKPAPPAEGAKAAASAPAKPATGPAAPKEPAAEKPPAK
jgi:hypothetical protein